MAVTNVWAGKVLALVKTGQPAAAIAQIRVAPDVKSLKALQAGLAARPASAGSPASASSRDVQIAIADSIAALTAPRLHRSP